MKLQNFEKKRKKLTTEFRDLLSANPTLKEQQLKLSWSNWGFGMEPLEKTAQRLHRNGIEWIELHGNRYGKYLGYKGEEVVKILSDYNIKVAGICGMFGPENDLSSNSGISRQNALDYIYRQLDLCQEVQASYMLIVSCAVGRPVAYDDSEFDRSVQTLRMVADEFVKAKVRGAVEPIRSAEVSIIHTIADAKRYIAAIDHHGIKHINGDVYHMHTEESNIGEALLDAGDMLVNLHLADSNRCALGHGSLDLDAILMALYVIGYSEGLRFVTPEPLGPGGDPYPAMFGKPDEAMLDKLVADTVKYYMERESEIKSF